MCSTGPALLTWFIRYGNSLGKAYENRVFTAEMNKHIIVFQTHKDECRGYGKDRYFNARTFLISSLTHRRCCRNKAGI